MVFHRALSRLHLKLIDEGIHQPTADVGRQLVVQLDRAIRESADRASPAGKKLWELEEQRLRKRGGQYQRDWQAFVHKWQEASIHPRPDLLEKGFGLRAEPGEAMADPLVIRVDDVEVRIGGRIDRVDVAETADGLVFWVIDYKTGRSSHYTGAKLESFDRLQLTLYALAVERVLLAGQASRPLGLAYWLVTDTGPKVVMPSPRKLGAWMEDPQSWAAVRELLELAVTRIVSEVRSGTFPLQPAAIDCTQRCSFGQICRITQARNVGKTWELGLQKIS